MRKFFDHVGQSVDNLLITKWPPIVSSGGQSRTGHSLYNILLLFDNSTFQISSIEQCLLQKKICPTSE